jgi:hypothetical protein
MKCVKQEDANIIPVRYTKEEKCAMNLLFVGGDPSFCSSDIDLGFCVHLYYTSWSSASFVCEKDNPELTSEIYKSGFLDFVHRLYFN